MMRNSSNEDDDEVFPLPGFRFHPTDEELVGFYLRRKVEKKPMRIELIEHVDIYKYDPWDLPKQRKMEKESYFFCKRGRKYRNSKRPNRGTGSGFWKATGIDKPVYSDETAEGRESIIGLKKTLVYYQGSAAKSTKTDWMMHEFRLSNKHQICSSASSQEAEVWTLCRIFNRNASSRKYTPVWREVASSNAVDSSSDQEAYINFGDAMTNNKMSTERFNKLHDKELSWMAEPPSMSNIEGAKGQLLAYGSWDELRSVVEFALHPSPL